MPAQELEPLAAGAGVAWRATKQSREPIGQLSDPRALGPSPNAGQAKSVAL